MKKRLATIGFLFVFCIMLAPVFSFGQEADMTGNEMVIVSPSPMASITPVPDYYMVYPGLLPDSPLYMLKTMRDRVISLMIGDPLKKAEFDLLQADKRIGAAMMLIDYGKDQKELLAVSTISKGLNYYDEAMQKAFEAKKQGASIMEVKAHLKKAGTMYVYLLEKEKKKTTKTTQTQIDAEILRLQKLLTLVSQL